MLRNLAAALDFPDYYGHNLAALNDCLRDVGSGENGLSPSQAGLALTIS